MDNEKWSGFFNKYQKLNFIDKPSQLICGICNDIFQLPHQTKCGCRFCLFCFKTFYKTGSKNCPNNSDDCVNNTLNDLSFDAAVNKDVMKLKVHCPHESCGVIKKLKEIIDHVDECEFRMVKCTMCNGDFEFKNFKTHKDNECSKREHKCTYCSMIMPYDNYTSEHLNSDFDDLCENYSINECPNKCSTKGFIHNLREHLKICSNAKQKCPLSTSDCSNCKFNDKELKEHFDENLFKHNQYLMKNQLELESKNKKMESKMFELESKNKKLDLQNTDIFLKYKRLESICNDFESKISSLENKIKELETSKVTRSI